MDPHNYLSTSEILKMLPFFNNSSFPSHHERNMNTNTNTNTNTTIGEVGKLISEERYFEAIKILFQVLETQECDIKDVECDLIFATNGCSTQLVQSGQESNANRLWGVCLKHCRDQSSLFYYSYARFLFSMDMIIQAIPVMKHAIRLNPDFLLACEGVENFKSLVVDQWHFRMINDRQRNEAYNTAIQNALQRIPNAIVLDIGGGTGLLSMFAARAGASHVYCCEVSPEMAYLARLCIEKNGYADKITVIEAHSTSLFITNLSTPSEQLESSSCCGLPQHVSIIVTELVDSGLLGEHIIEVLHDATTRLLIPNGGIVIPHGAELFGVPIMSQEIANRQSLQLNPNNSDNCDDSWSSISYHQMTHSGSQHQSLPFPVLSLDEDYTCESFQSLVNQSRIVPLSEPVKLGYITFTSSTFTPADSPQISFPLPHERSFPFSITQSGSLDALATWFTLHLESPLTSNSPTIDTSPLRVNSGWDQALHFSSQHLRRSVSCGDIILLNTSITDDKIKLHSTVNQQQQQQQLRTTALYPIGEMDFASLNNHFVFDRSMKHIQSLINSTLESIEPQHNSEFVRVVELTNSWRSYLLTEYINRLQSNDKDCHRHQLIERIIHCTSEEQSQYLNHLLGYHCSQSMTPKFNPFSSPHFPKIFSGSLLEQSSLFQNSAGGGCCVKNVLICEVVEGCGLLKQNLFSDLSFLFQSISRLSSPSQTFRIFPHSITVNVAILEHASLWRHSRVQEGNTLQIDVSTITNDFGVTMIREVDLNHIPFPSQSLLPSQSPSPSPSPGQQNRFLSSPQKAMKFKLSDMIQQDPSHSSQPLISLLAIPCLCTGIFHGIAVWYTIHLTEEGEEGKESPEEVIDTGPDCSENSGRYWRQVVFLSPSSGGSQPREVLEGSVIDVRVAIDRISGVWCR